MSLSPLSFQSGVISQEPFKSKKKTCNSTTKLITEIAFSIFLGIGIGIGCSFTLGVFAIGIGIGSAITMFAIVHKVNACYTKKKNISPKPPIQNIPFDAQEAVVLLPPTQIPTTVSQPSYSSKIHSNFLPGQIQGKKNQNTLSLPDSPLKAQPQKNIDAVIQKEDGIKPNETLFQKQVTEKAKNFTEKRKGKINVSPSVSPQQPASDGLDKIYKKLSEKLREIRVVVGSESDDEEEGEWNDD